MPKNLFRFRQFSILQEKTPARVGTDGVLLGAWAKVEGAKRILDVGTGTGLIALMAAQRNPSATVHAVELDGPSAAEARFNFDQSPFGERLTLFEQDFRQFSPPDSLPYDVVLSNPPFFRAALAPKTRERAQWRHQIGLETLQLFQFCERWLSPNGSMQLVLPVEEAAVAVSEGIAHGFHCTARIGVQPSPGKPINRYLLHFTSAIAPMETGQITVQTGGANAYSDEFIQLTRAFYPWMD